MRQANYHNKYSAICEHNYRVEVVKIQPREALKKARIEKGYTQAQLAEQAGITRAFLCNIERGKYSPSLTIAKALAIALEKPLDEIFFNVDVHKKNKRPTGTDS